MIDRLERRVSCRLAPQRVRDGAHACVRHVHEDEIPAEPDAPGEHRRPAPRIKISAVVAAARPSQTPISDQAGPAAEHEAHEDERVERAERELVSEWAAMRGPRHLRPVVRLRRYLRTRLGGGRHVVDADHAAPVPDPGVRCDRSRRTRAPRCRPARAPARATRDAGDSGDAASGRRAQGSGQARGRNDEVPDLEAPIARDRQGRQHAQRPQ